MLHTTKSECSRSHLLRYGFIFLFVVPLLAQKRALKKSVRFERLSLQQGLSHSRANWILQDATGYLWIGTEDGLNRFDGYHFRTYYHDPDDPGSLSENSISCMVEDHGERIWVGTNGGGLNQYDPIRDRFIRFKHDPDHPASLSNDRIRALLIDGNDNLWVGTEKGLNKRAPDSAGQFIRFQDDPGETPVLEQGWITALLEDRDGKIWVGTSRGKLVQFEGDSPDPVFRIGFPVEGPDGTVEEAMIQTIHEDRDGILWIGTIRGIVLFDPRAKRRIEHGSVSNPVVAGAIITSIFQDRQGKIWIGTYDRGLLQIDGGSFQNFLPDKDNPLSLGSDEITCVFEDRSGIVWIGTGTGGVQKFNPRHLLFGHYRLDHLLAEGDVPRVTAIHEDPQEALWIGTSRGLFHFNADLEMTAHFPLHSNPLKGPQDVGVFAILEDEEEGILWLGTRKGLVKLQHAGSGSQEISFQYFKNDPENSHSLSSDYITCLRQTKSGQLWIGTPRGLNRLDSEKERFVRYRFEEQGNGGKNHNLISAIHEDRTGAIWVGTYGGLKRWNPGEADSTTSYSKEPGNPRTLSHNHVLSLLEDRNGVLWVGTDHGLNRLERDSSGQVFFVAYHKKDGLPSDVIKCMLEDDRGYLWLSTNKGLIRFETHTGKVKAYQYRNGLQSDEFTFGASHRGASGRLFFGGGGGLNAFYPRHIMDNPLAPPIAIEDFLLFNQPVPIGGPDSPLHAAIHKTQKLTLTRKDSIFSFEFTALDYANPEKNQYAYRLDPLQDRWTYTDSKNRFATYSNLDPGNYVFRVKGSNGDGIWNSTGVSLPIYMRPPPWRTWWAHTLYLLILTYLLFIYIRSHHRKLARERFLNEELDRKVVKRTAQLQKKNEELSENHRQRVRQARQLKNQARRLSEMDALKTRFFVNISHEFRTPLTLILGPLDDLIAQAAAEKNGTRQLTMIRRNGERLMKLIDELLDVSKLEAGQMTLQAQRQDLVAFLARYRAMFSPIAERKQIAMVFQSDEESLALYFDRDKLDKILTNLLSNAFKFTPERGKILLKLSSQDANWIGIRIKDTGPGIPKEQLSHVFDRFFQKQGRTPEFPAGTGIGLALVKELVVLHGGRIEVRSEPGFGCEFTIWLPRGRSHLQPEQITKWAPPPEDSSHRNPCPSGDHFFIEEPLPAIQPQPSAEPSGQVSSILMVEDNPEVRAYLREHLGRIYQVYEADGAAQALTLAREKMPDIILSDVMMPGMDGFAFCRTLKTDEKTCHIPVILLTAKAGVESNVAGLETGADDYLVKPFKMKILLSRIANLIENRRKLRDLFGKQMFLQPSEIPITSTDQAFLAKAVAVLEKNLKRDPFGVHELADEMGFSRRQLHRKFTTLIGKKPSDFIRQIRLERAAQMLKANAGNISEVAYAVGFNQPEYFSQLFRKAFGRSPSQYARSCQSQDT